MRRWICGALLALTSCSTYHVDLTGGDASAATDAGPSVTDLAASASFSCFGPSTVRGAFDAPRGGRAASVVLGRRVLVTSAGDLRLGGGPLVRGVTLLWTDSTTACGEGWRMRVWQAPLDPDGQAGLEGVCQPSARSVRTRMVYNGNVVGGCYSTHSRTSDEAAAASYPSWAGVVAGCGVFSGASFSATTSDLEWEHFVLGASDQSFALALWDRRRGASFMRLSDAVVPLGEPVALPEPAYRPLGVVPVGAEWWVLRHPADWSRNEVTDHGPLQVLRVGASGNEVSELPAGIGFGVSGSELALTAPIAEGLLALYATREPADASEPPQTVTLASVCSGGVAARQRIDSAFRLTPLSLVRFGDGWAMSLMKQLTPDSARTTDLYVLDASGAVRAGPIAIAANRFADAYLGRGAERDDLWVLSSESSDGTTWDVYLRHVWVR